MWTLQLKLHLLLYLYFSIRSAQVLVPVQVQINVIKPLFIAGAATMKTTCEQNAKLAAAAEKGSVDTVRKLIEAGADVNACKYCKIQDLMSEEVMDSAGWFEDIRDDKNVKTGRFNTALLLAVRNGHHRCAELLVDAGADVNMANGLDLTALMNAICFENNSKCLYILIKAGADVNFKNTLGQTALHFAVFCDNHKGVKTLLDAGANINAYDDKKYIALITAVMYKSPNCIDLLIKSGADINTRDNESLTPLMMSAKFKYPKGTDLLLKAGADVNILDDIGQNALMYAALPYDFPNYRCICLLLQAGSHIVTLRADLPFLSKKASEILMCDWVNDKNERILRAMFAAGEVVGGTHVQKRGSIHPVPDYVQELNRPEGNLKDMCRRAIRKYLMELSPVNLLCKIPQLGLQKLMEDYLLYGITLDASDDSDETYNYYQKRKAAVGPRLLPDMAAQVFDHSDSMSVNSAI